jgi:hypothetical protein
MRLGPKMTFPPSADELAANPELPTSEVDVQVLDAKGQPIHLQMGGDSFIDGSWEMPSVADVDPAERRADYALMREAVAAFRAMNLPAGLQELRRAGIQLGLGVEITPDKPGLLAPKQSTKTAVAWGPSSINQWDFRVRKKRVSLIGIPVAEHSAVHLRGWSGGTIVFNVETCNHGTCATSSAMTTHCVMPGFRADDGTHSRYFYFGETGGCTTPYAWNSGPGTHNCNDDSELQARAAYHDSPQSTTGGSCGAVGAHYYAPGCTY